MALESGDTTSTRPAPEHDCVADFCNSDSFGAAFASNR